MSKLKDPDRIRLVNEAKRALSIYCASSDAILEAANALMKEMENKRALKRLWLRADARVREYDSRKKKGEA